jgi:hypothetical protein
MMTEKLSGVATARFEIQNDLGLGMGEVSVLPSVDSTTDGLQTTYQSSLGVDDTPTPASATLQEYSSVSKRVKDGRDSKAKHVLVVDVEHWTSGHLQSTRSDQLVDLRREQIFASFERDLKTVQKELRSSEWNRPDPRCRCHFSVHLCRKVLAATPLISFQLHATCQPTWFVPRLGSTY